MDMGISRWNERTVKQEMFFFEVSLFSRTLKGSGLCIQCLLKFKGGPKLRGLGEGEKPH